MPPFLLELRVQVDDETLFDVSKEMKNFDSCPHFWIVGLHAVAGVKYSACHVVGFLPQKT